MTKLDPLPQILISQKKEWGEMLTGFETANKYVISDPSGAEIYAATEEGGSTMARLFLKSSRPFDIKIRDLTNPEQVVLSISRPFNWYFYVVTVTDDKGAEVGKVKREWSVLKRIYTLLDGEGKAFAKIEGPLFHPWTFNIIENGQQTGQITKKWSGMLKEALSDADNFGAEFPPGWNDKKKSILLGAIFLIDFVHFEDKGGH